MRNIDNGIADGIIYALYSDSVGAELEDWSPLSKI
jgi:hypothetical protein